MVKNNRPKCYYCKLYQSEERCIYCTNCRKKMAKGEIRSNFGEEKRCQICGKQILDEKPLSNVVCIQCINEI